ncbi:MAG: DUF4292 domain-containing protein [Flavobacteriaceae bacterium]|nr:DUF4292 domain-containing protein [Flavobacteriaceae bacterium]
MKLKNNLLKLTLFLLVFVTFESCKSKKTAVGDDLRPRAIRSVINTHEKSFPDFETLSGKMRASVEGLKLSETLSITYRVEKDQKIWMSAKAFGLITVGKLYMTPNRVQFYEKMGNQYFDGDFSLISDLLGVEVDFYQVQSMIFAQSLANLDVKTMQGNLEEDKYVFRNTNAQQQELSIDIDPKHFRLLKQELKYKHIDRNLRISYSDFKEVNQSYYPGLIEIFGRNQGDEMKINIDIRSVNKNEDLSFPFEIPRGYKEMKL